MIQTSEIVIFEPSSEPLGYSYEDWCIRWCRWLLSTPKNTSPAFDEYGHSSHINQTRENVLFLCQTIESVNYLPKRIIRLPKITFIFMPVINWISVLGGSEKNENDLKALARKMMDRVVKLRVLFNDKSIPISLWNYRIQSQPFEVNLPRNNVLNSIPGRTSVVVDGFWLFFQPLVNDLTIETYGECRSGATKISVNYHICPLPC